MENYEIEKQQQATPYYQLCAVRLCFFVCVVQPNQAAGDFSSSLFVFFLLLLCKKENSACLVAK